jgi:repressor LexA
MQLTERQARVYRFIREFMEEYGFPPTRAEIADGLGFRSANAAEDHLKALARKGAIELWTGASRGIRLLGAEAGIPVVGRVAAGSPILAEENVEDRLEVDPVLFSPAADYFLRVRGMSMRDAGILNGDLLAVHKTSEARSGQVVVARIDDEVTVKRFRRRGNTVWLMPENPEFEPIELNLRHDALAIEGLGVGVIRNGRRL